MSLGVQNVTVRGAGATLGDTVLDYAKQETADDGFAVTAGGFTVENLTLKNTPGNGIVVDMAVRDQAQQARAARAHEYASGGQALLPLARIGGGGEHDLFSYRVATGLVEIGSDAQTLDLGESFKIFGTNEA